MKNIPRVVAYWNTVSAKLNGAKVNPTRDVILQTLDEMQAKFGNEFNLVMIHAPTPKVMKWLSGICDERGLILQTWLGTHTKTIPKVCLLLIIDADYSSLFVDYPSGPNQIIRLISPGFNGKDNVYKRWPTCLHFDVRGRVNTLDDVFTSKL